MTIGDRPIPSAKESQWREIEEFVAGVSELSESPNTIEEFATNTMARTVELLDAIGGCLWLMNAEGGFDAIGRTVSYAHEWSEQLLPMDSVGHEGILKQVAKNGDSGAFAFRHDDSDEEFLRVVSSCRLVDDIVAVLEVCNPLPFLATHGWAISVFWEWWES